MNTSPKQAAALELLAQTGMRRSNYEPPMLRLLWRLGIDMPPPHFASPARNLAFSGLYFGISWGVGFYFFAKVILDMPIATFWPACAAGLVFGLCVAAYYAYGARKHGILRWEAFSGS